MEDDSESVDLIPKLQELHIIQIFGFDGRIKSNRKSGSSIDIFSNHRENSAESPSGSGAFDLCHRQQDFHSQHQDQQAGVSLWPYSQHFNVGRFAKRQTGGLGSNQSHGNENVSGLRSSLTLCSGIPSSSHRVGLAEEMRDLAT